MGVRGAVIGFTGFSVGTRVFLMFRFYVAVPFSSTLGRPVSDSSQKRGFAPKAKQKSRPPSNSKTNHAQEGLHRRRWVDLEPPFEEWSFYGHFYQNPKRIPLMLGKLIIGRAKSLKP